MELRIPTFGGPHSPAKLMAPRSEGGYGLGGVAMDVRRKSVDSPLYFGAEVLGREYLRTPCKEHIQAAQAIKEQRNVMLLLPRGHIKTTLMDEVGTIWQWLPYYNDRILFAQASMDNAKALAKQVRQHLRENQSFKEVFPEYAINTSDDEGQVLSFSVPCRTTITREASLEIGTPDTNLSGRHYEVVASSDIVNEQNTPPAASFEMMEKIIEWYGTTRSLLDTTNNRSHRRIDGTRWSFGDLYGKILEGLYDPKNPMNDPAIARKAFVKIVNGIRMDSNGLPIPIWPEVRNQMSLIEDMAAMSPYLWAANMANDPLQLGKTMFMSHWFKHYDEMPENMSIAITLDPAFSTQDKNPKADRSAIVVSGVTPLSEGGDLYVLAIRVGRWSARDLLENLWALIDTWNPDWVGIENQGQQMALIDMFHEDMMRTGRSVPYRELKSYGKNKTVRAMGLQAHAQKQGVYVKLPEMQELVDEFCRFTGGSTSGEKDDIVDALVYRAMDMRGGYLPQVVRRERLDASPATPPLTGAELLANIEDPDGNPLWWETV